MGITGSKTGRSWTVVATIAVLCGIIAVILFGVPKYQVWQKGMAGQARLAEAEWNRQIVVQEAAAANESVILLAGVERIRAGGVAAAIEIIGNKLKDSPEYLHYLWVQSLQTGNNTVIYIPTEANLPILGATRQYNPLAAEGD